MTELQFKHWLDQLRDIWEQKTPEKIVNIVAKNFVWHETPFNKPYTTKEELVNDWKLILNQDNIKVETKILIVNDDLGVAQWSADFERLPSREKAQLNGVFVVSLDNGGKCTEFHMWFNSK